tara:strand:+ start:1215 stop:1361 length:147 start_codon:yes stop_codon:yes gene_type:complete
MEPTSLSLKIDQAARDYWRTLDPKYKKEWYRLIRVFHNVKSNRTQKIS